MANAINGKSHFEPKRLKCEVSRGMFSDECVITVRDAEGIKHSFFVSKVDTIAGNRVKIGAKKIPNAWIAALPTAEPDTTLIVSEEDIV